MALFKVSRGTSQNLPDVLTEGYCWYTYDDSKFYIDFKDENGVLQRKALNAEEAEKLAGYNIATSLTTSEVEIPTSYAVFECVSSGVADAVSESCEYTDSQITSRFATDTLTASRVLISNLQGKIAASAVTSTELGYLDGVTSAIQSQLDGKAPINHGIHIANLGQNPITSTADDTPAKWIELGTGIAQFSTAGLLNNQPHSYGLLINYVTQWEVAQIWFSMKERMYQRTGNHTGFSDWNMIADSSYLPISTSANDGQFLRVVNSKPTWVTVDSAEEASF